MAFQFEPILAIVALISTFGAQILMYQAR